MEALALAGIKAELRTDGLPTHGGAAELAARLAEHGDGWTVNVKTEEKAEVKLIKVETNTVAGGTCPRCAKVNEAPTHPTAAQQAVKAAALRRLGLSEDIEKPMREAPSSMLPVPPHNSSACQSLFIGDFREAELANAFKRITPSSQAKKM